DPDAGSAPRGRRAPVHTRPRGNLGRYPAPGPQRRRAGDDPTPGQRAPGDCASRRPGARIRSRRRIGRQTLTAHCSFAKRGAPAGRYITMEVCQLPKESIGKGQVIHYKSKDGRVVAMFVSGKFDDYTSFPPFVEDAREIAHLETA